MTTATPVLVSVGDAATWTGRTTRTIKRWAANGRIDKHSTPQGVRYDLSQLPPKTADGPAPAPDKPGRGRNTSAYEPQGSART